MVDFTERRDDNCTQSILHVFYTQQSVSILFISIKSTNRMSKTLTWALIILRNNIQCGARKTGPLSRRPTWRRSRTLYRKLNKCKCKVLTRQRRCWKWSPCTSMHFCARRSILSYTRCNSAVSIRRIDTAELHRVYDNMLRRTQKCIDVQGDHFQHLCPVSTLHLHLFNFLYRVRDLHSRCSTRQRAGFSCATLYNRKF